MLTTCRGGCRKCYALFLIHYRSQHEAVLNRRGKTSGGKSRIDIRTSISVRAMNISIRTSNKLQWLATYNRTWTIMQQTLSLLQQKTCYRGIVSYSVCLQLSALNEWYWWLKQLFVFYVVKANTILVSLLVVPHWSRTVQFTQMSLSLRVFKQPYVMQ